MKIAAKRFLAFLMVFAISFSMIPISVSAASPELTLKVDATGGLAGSDVSVKLQLENNPGISSIALKVTYDSVLTLQSIDYNADMGGNAQQPQTMNSPVSLLWIDSAQNFTSETATFATLSFHISESAPDNYRANISVDFDPDDVYQNDPANPGEYIDVGLNVVNGAVTVYACIPGDINGDQKVNNRDASRLMQYLAGWDVTVNDPALDTNGDGKVNNRDASRLMQYLAGWDVELKCGNVTSQKCSHTMEAVAFKAATCTEPGNIAYWHCTKCNKYFNSELGLTEIALANTVIQASHALESVAYQAPTTSAPGRIACWHCTVCSKYFLNAEATEEVAYNDTIIPAIEEGKTTVQYDLYGGDDYLSKIGVENPNPSEFVSESGMNLSPLTAPAGYEFKGWRIVDGTAEGTPVTKIDPQTPGTTIRLRAVWSLIKYNISYVNYKTPVGEVVKEDALYYYVNLGKPNLPNPEVKNYVFLGWYDESGNEVESIPAGTTGDIVLDGYWTSQRNLARAKPLEDPIILENADEGVIYFAYELGTIENIPISDDIWTIQSVAGLSQQASTTKTTSISSTQASSISDMISRETVDSSTWTLSEEWKQSTDVNETWANQRGMTVEEANTKATSSSNTYSATDSTGGSKASTATDGTTTLDYNSQNYTHGNSAEFDVKVGGSFSAEAEAGVWLAKAKSGFTVEASVEAGYKQQQETNEHTGTDTTKVNTNVSSDTSTWNSSSTRQNTISASESVSSSKALSEIISSTKGYGKSYSESGGNSSSRGTSQSASTSVNSSSSLSYSTADTVTTTSTYSTDGRLEGKYRLVIAGTAHVYGVVGYDVASRSYFAYTYSVMDDKTYEFLDYTPVGYNFDDYENSVLPFEIPYDVYEYVAGEIVMTDGITYRTNSRTGEATIAGYTGDSGDVIIPTYISSGNTVYKVTGITASAFAGKAIRSVILGKFIDEIPDGAFMGCTALEEISGYYTKIGSNAFRGCVNLNDYRVSKKVISIGDNAFAGVPKITVDAISATAAREYAEEILPGASNDEVTQKANEKTQELVDAAIRSGAQDITLNLTATTDGASLAMIVPAISRFELNGGKRAFADTKLVSYATETVIREVAIENYNTIPLEIYSDNLTLEVVSVDSSNFAMTLASEHPMVTLIRDSVLTSTRGNAVVCKDPTVTANVSGGAMGSLDITGNVYVCGSIIGEDNLFIENGEIITITPEEYEKYISGNYTVTLDANEGNVSAGSVGVKFGKPYGDLPEPTRDHYSFAGWYTDPTNGELITAASIFEELNDITLYAHWTLNTFNITFNANGGAVSQTAKEVVYGDQVGSLPTPTKDYYNFDGWYTEASEGQKYTEATVFETANDIILYAHWTLKPTSGWVLADNRPSGSQVVNQKWTYDQRTNTESRNTSLPGYTQYDSYWVQSGSGQTNYASFPSGFDTGHYIYNNFAKSPYTPYENATSKREVSNDNWAGYVYWHWAYNAAFYNETRRAISSRYLGSGDGGFCYGYFYAFTNSTNFPYLDNYYCNSQNLPSYNCWSALSGYNAQNISGLCTPRFFRFDYYTSRYTDYYKMFRYYKIDAKESSSEVSAGGLISNVQRWVQYREK